MVRHASFEKRARPEKAQPVPRPEKNQAEGRFISNCCSMAAGCPDCPSYAAIAADSEEPAFDQAEAVILSAFATGYGRAGPAKHSKLPNAEII
jgi:hypothetical protein